MEWTRRLDSTLRVLVFEYVHKDVIYDLSNLHNIREFATSDQVNHNLEPFLNRNKDTLPLLKFEIRSYSVNQLSMLLTNLKYIRKLKLMNFQPDQPFDISGLSQLEELHIVQHPNFIVDRKNIKKLVMYNTNMFEYNYINMEEIAKFENLENLFIMFQRIDNFKPLNALTRLRSLYVDILSDDNCNEDLLKNFIEDLPDDDGFFLSVQFEDSCG